MTKNSNENINQDDKAVYPISTAARLLNVSVHTLRKYESDGLIVPFKSPGNQRLYSNNDIKRINLIRYNIKEKKISINGLLALISLIPCWKIKQCSDDDRLGCKAFKENLSPCWLYKHTDNICATNDCRDCDVYRKNSDFENISETIKLFYERI
jgi:MerR family transcriptional regulator/heat shock protein HspR